MSYRGPINFFHAPTPPDVEARILSSLPAKHLQAIREIAYSTPHPVTRPLVRFQAGMRNIQPHYLLPVASRGQFS
jgi:hypothetical protein